MVSFEDPITDTTYRPLSDPVGTLSKSGMIVAGLTMTLLLFGIAQNQVLPMVGGFVNNVTGGLVQSGSDGPNIFGDP